MYSLNERRDTADLELIVISYGEGYLFYDMNHSEKTLQKIWYIKTNLDNGFLTTI